MHEPRARSNAEHGQGLKGLKGLKPGRAGSKFSDAFVGQQVLRLQSGWTEHSWAFASMLVAATQGCGNGLLGRSEM